MAWVELSALVKSCARPYHSGCFFQQRWSHKPQMELFRQRPHTAARARNQMKTCHEIGNWKCDKSGIGNATNPGAEKCWCVACGRRRRLFHTGALLTKPLSVEECLGHGPLLPLKANVHELRLVLRLGGLNFGHFFLLGDGN